MAKRKSFEEKNKFIHPTRKKIIDTVFGKGDNNQRVHGYEKKDDRHEVGDVWTDSDGITWKQEKGYRANVTQMDDVRQYLDKLNTCADPECNTIKYTPTDKKLIKKTGYCIECLIKFEAPLIADGTFPFYEDYKITKNKLSYIKDLRQKYQDAFNGVKSYIEVVNENGTFEKWNSNIDVDKVKADLTEDMKNADEAIQLLIERKAALEDKLREMNHPELITL